ncbi:serine hydrolase domain-containing protein [Streptosporangium sp. NPDC002544]|uniref:serine hydrolase domain-containing protein n=1 Tax=Streptosporangium sp. NPDC002544 TaxID=3154538 RepID=UPI003326DDE8
MRTRAGSSLRRQAISGLGLLLACVTVLPAPAVAATADPSPAATGAGLDHRALRQTLDAIRDAGMYGVYSDVRNGPARWSGAAGVADVDTGRPVRPEMPHRVGSITKTFTAVAILQQVEKGRIELDAPIARYLPDLIPGERGRQVTVRMLLNHTSGIADYIAGAFPSLLVGSTQSVDDNRLRTAQPEELARIGLESPPTNEPGRSWAYSNTNYVIAGLLLRKVTRTDPERYVTDHVIRKAGLRGTYFPRTPFILGPHSKAYESFYGLIDPPRDYSVYNPSWFGMAGALVSTMDDLNRFYRLLLDGKLLRPAELAQMKTTVPVTDGLGNVVMNYGLGVYNEDTPCGRVWGHSGGVFGMVTYALAREDGGRRLSIGVNLTKYNEIDGGRVVPHPIDYAMGGHLLQALCGPATPSARGIGTWTPFQADQVRVKR